jgi:type I site-specific restriction endonuclease
MISEGVDIRRLRVLVYATTMATNLGFRQITGRIVRTDPKNGSEDYGTVTLPAEPRLLEMAERMLEEVPPVQREPLMIRDPRHGSTTIRGPRDDARFVPLGSTGELTMIDHRHQRSVGTCSSGRRREALRRGVRIADTTVRTSTRRRT